MRQNIILLTFLFLICPAAVWPQVTNNITPSATQERSMDILEYFRNQTKLQSESRHKEERIIEKTDDGSSGEEFFEHEVSFQLKDVIIPDSQILSKSAISQLAAPFIGKKVNMADIKTIVNGINRLYQEKNFPSARAVLPAQEIKDGVVRIELIEGFVGRYTITGNDTTRTGFINKRISVREGELLDLEQLEKEMILFNAVYDAQVSASLKPGEVFGATDIVINMKEPKKYEGLVYGDNTGREETGRERLGLSLTRNSLFGIRDRLSIGGVFSDGTIGYNINYNLPINRKGTSLGISYDRSDVEVKSGQLKGLNVEGDSSAASITLNQPLVISRTIKSSGHLGYNIKSSDTDVSGITILENDVRSLFLGADFLKFDTSGYWYLNHILTRGFENFGGDREFLKYNGEFSRMQYVSKEWFVLVHTGFQLSADPFLPSSEQIQVGGLTTVRGYRESTLIGDAGYFINTELHFPIRIIRQNSDLLRNRLSGFLFLDHGATMAVKEADDDNYLLSTGMGFNLQFNKDFAGRFIAGVPLNDDVDRAGNDIRFHFYTQYQF